MRVGLLTASFGLWPDFFERHLPHLEAEGVRFPVLVFDENRRRGSRLRRKFARARVHARIERCSVPAALVRAAVYALVGRRSRSGGGRKRALASLPAGTRLVRVPSANAALAAETFRREACDLVCMVNVRILTPRTLAAIGAPVVNVHLSDPRFVRGAQPVLWEVLAGRTEIVVTGHLAVEEVDAGGILEHRPAPIVYRGGLAATRRATLAAARGPVGEVLDAAIRRHRDGAAASVPFTPGPLRATPRVRDVLRAEWLCRRRSAAPRSGGSSAAS